MHAQDGRSVGVGYWPGTMSQQTPPFATDVRNLISTPVAGAATEQQRRQQTQLVACLTTNNEVHLLCASEGGIIAS